jgi:hypothetical protein
MVNSAVMNGNSPQPAVDEPAATRDTSNQNLGSVAFVRASDENLQPGNLDKTTAALGAGTVDLGINDVPAYGYLRWLYILVQATGGTGAGAVAAEDGPWSVLRNIALTEPNGATILQVDDGFDLYLMNKLGGYLPAISADPRNSPNFSAVSAAGNFQFMLRVPVEVSGRDALGALPNQDSAGQFKFRCQIGTAANVFTTPPATTNPVIRVRAWLAAWDQPAAQSAGMANQVSPPAVGTTSYWSKQSGIAVANGNNTIELKRKGNYLRQIIFVLRNAGSRATAQSQWPAETRFLRDAFPARYYLDEVWKQQMFERTGFTSAGDAANQLNNGVRFHDYMHEFDGELGRENRDLWQPTRGSTRLEIQGSFGAATTLDIIYNDVAIADNVFL